MDLSTAKPRHADIVLSSDDEVQNLPIQKGKKSSKPGSSPCSSDEEVEPKSSRKSVAPPPQSIVGSSKAFANGDSMAYVTAKREQKEPLPHIRREYQLPMTNEKIFLDHYKSTDYEVVYSMLKEAVEEGQSFPQSTMEREEFEQYYLSHDVFVVRDERNQAVMGSFYVKPKFPGRSSHICEAAFLVHPYHRKKGIGEFMYRNFLRIARDFGYEGSYFSVYASNVGSLRICRKLGFTEIGIISKAGKLKGLGDVDILQFYYDLTTLSEND